jgi:hypothetical protein
MKTNFANRHKTKPTKTEVFTGFCVMTALFLTIFIILTN